MVLSEEKKKEYMKRFLLSRMRLLCNNGFYGLLLMHMPFKIDEKCKNAATDGKYIVFGPNYLDELDDSELDYVLMHEVLHVALQHCFRKGDRDPERYNKACDIIVNSNILYSNRMNVNSITLRKYGKPCRHQTPDGREGYLLSVEEVYALLPVEPEPEDGKKNIGTGNSQGSGEPDNWDDHTQWDNNEQSEKDIKENEEEWNHRILNAGTALSVTNNESKIAGKIPMFAERMLKEFRKSQLDWRFILNDFIQEEVVDYSFNPPDRRFDGYDFFLPDFNDKDEFVKDILFMIDTSGSMSEEDITVVYSEVKGAIDMFDGKLTGWLGFFDAAVTEPKQFMDEKEFEIIRPYGGGGTSFHVVLECARNFKDELACLIILTDGYAPFPEEDSANGIPVLWVLTTDDVEPPWGRVARVKVEKSI